MIDNLLREIERQQREYRGRLKMLEPGSAEWGLMQVRIEGNETIKKNLMGTKMKIVNGFDGFNGVDEFNGSGYENEILAQKQKIRLAGE